ncbi:ribonuclease H-like domain-containing protein [Rhizophagus irregularis DAOM 181602=DAOM 197198]|nr:ribonuclease H-like domain-containing protein [Rhizophagus irregularis DAOM 181602=DAOM 197198]
MTLKEYPYLSLLYYNDECNDGYEFKSSGLCLGCENEYSKGKVIGRCIKGFYYIKYQFSSHEKKIMTPEIISLITHQANRNNPTYNHIYFCNKILDQYSNLYREFNSENFDYYGITDGTSYPLCKLDHDDEESIYRSQTYSEPNSIKVHLALSCHNKVPSDIKEKFLFMVKTRGESRTFQLEAAEQICDRTVVKFFICCGVSFRLIEHPFFIDMVKSLYLEYDPSSANTLSQDFLYEELANIVVDQHLELKRTKNLMLGFDG